ncbi:hypothetical protein NON20_07025 [Synechocystis sp. B12]|nr:hypothetical protein NON20_07025 [Synechocystis sp. B12]
MAEKSGLTDGVTFSPEPTFNGTKVFKGNVLEKVSLHMVIFWKYSGNATELPKPVPRNEIIYRPLAIGMVGDRHGNSRFH